MCNHPKVPLQVVSPRLPPAESVHQPHRTRVPRSHGVGRAVPGIGGGSEQPYQGAEFPRRRCPPDGRRHPLPDAQHVSVDTRRINDRPSDTADPPPRSRVHGEPAVFDGERRVPCPSQLVPSSPRAREGRISSRPGSRPETTAGRRPAAPDYALSTHASPNACRSTQSFCTPSAYDRSGSSERSTATGSH